MNTNVSVSNFEKSLKELETIVTQMESENLPLDKALDQFERGVNLANQCQKLLKIAEQKIQKISND